MGTIYEDYEVWVVDDENQVLEATKGFLEPLGYRVKTFADPTVAQADLRGCKTYILFIVDHDFSHTEDPNYTGYDFAKFVKESYFLKRATPIIYLTGRERKSNFDIRQKSFPEIVPNVFLSKNEVALDVELLLDAVSAGFAVLETMETSIDEHGLEIALSIAEDWRF